jgi:hypothetical protein
MDAPTFWNLIATSKEAGRDDVDRQIEVLTETLATLPPEEIVAFDRTFRALMATAYRWDLWAAAYIINGGCSDDGFEYFRAWLIAQGERVFRDALSDPETLVDRADPDAEAEGMLYAAATAYESRVGAHLPDAESFPSDPAGEPWDDEDLHQMYPKLWTKFS